MTWWDCEGPCEESGGVLELDGVDLELELRCTEDGRTLAWWVDSQSGAWLWRVPVGSA